MNTQLMTPDTGSVVPKPTKTEMIDALVARAKVKNAEENARRKEARIALSKKINALAKKTLNKADKGEIEFRYLGWGNHPRYVEVRDVRVARGPELEAMLREYESLEGNLTFDETAFKRNLRVQLSGRKPNRLLDDPDMVKALDAYLDKMGETENTKSIS